LEVDFLIGDRIAIEVKAKANVGPHDLRSLHAIKEEGPFRRFICVSLDPHPRQVDGIEILPLAHFLKALWSGDFQLMTQENGPPYNPESYAFSPRTGQAPREH
jgi:hypothetical protein